MVKVHPLVIDQEVRHGYGIEQSANLHFKPTGIKLNETESSFVIYGDTGICVGNFPALL